MMNHPAEDKLTKSRLIVYHIASGHSWIPEALGAASGRGRFICQPPADRVSMCVNGCVAAGSKLWQIKYYYFLYGITNKILKCHFLFQKACKAEINSYYNDFSTNAIVALRSSACKK